jgi:hypothetical protein
MYTEPSAEPTAMNWPSGLKAARDQSQPTLNPSALQEKNAKRDVISIIRALLISVFIGTMSVLKIIVFYDVAAV